jgi:phospholipid/cholesterol/gamma-HCH transport system permease protein
MDSDASPPRFRIDLNSDAAVITLGGRWCSDQSLPAATALIDALAAAPAARWRWCAETDFDWDSHFMTRLLLCARRAQQQHIELDLAALPEGVQRLLAVATAVAPQQASTARESSLTQRLERQLRALGMALIAFIEFIGAAAIALARMLRGRANTRARDVGFFIQQCGPQAVGIVALIAVLVGMILAYLGSVQLRLFGAEVYVANLVALGMVREMGALMTAVIMAGRTGAAYAAQLGAMQANEEVDAITTLGISPMEYLVLPRLIALVLVMPLLVLFANVVGLVGGGLVAISMDVSFIQFVNQARDSVDLGDIASGLFKALVFGALIAVAGCQAGLASGRSSAAVGAATTRAVVSAIVYLVVADAGLNILYDKLGI